MLNPEALSALFPAVGVSVVAAALLVPELVGQRRNASSLPAIRRAQAHGLADLLPYRRLVRRDVVTLPGGEFVAAWEFAARDTSTLDEAAVVNTAYQVALTLGSLDVGTVAQFYTRRSPFTEYDRGRGERSPVLRTLDELREDFFTRHEPVFATRRFFVLTWQSPAAAAPVKRRARAALAIGAEEAVQSEDAQLADFEALCARVEGGFAALNVRRLGEDARGRSELLGFLRSTISGEESSLVVPPASLPLNAFLAQEFRGGFEPRVGGAEVGCVELATYPSETMPGILDRLASLGVAHTLCVRFMPMPLEEARKQHRGGWAANIGAATFRSGGLVDPHAVKQAEQSAEAYGAAADEYTRNGRTTIVLVLRAPTRNLVERGQRAVCAALEEAAFVGKAVRLAALDTWLSTLPGDATHGVRKHPLTALDVAHLVPLHETERGRRYAESESLPPQTPAVTYALGPGGTLSRVHLNGQRDLGHGLVCGQPGSGKSVMLAYLAAMAQARLPQLGVTMLDKGRSAYRLARMVDGTFYDLLAPGSPGFALFADVEQPAQARELLAILCEMLELWDVRVTADRSSSLEAAIRVLASIPRERRSLFAFVEQVQDPEGVLRPVLAKYARLGVLGSALDCSTDSFEAGRFNVVELERVLALEPRYLVPVLRVLMWKLVGQARRLRESTPDLHWLYVLDEVHAIARHPIGERFILDVLKMGRKENFFLWLASNSATDYTTMSGRNDLLMACATRIYFGDPAATDERTRGHYEDLQLTERGVDQFPYLGDREFLLHAPGSAVLQRLSLRLDREALGIVGTSRGNDRVDEYLARYPADRFEPHRWKVELLRSEGAQAAAERLQSIVEAGSDELLVTSR
jgi:type IV secretory pathway VirB4 component